MSQFSEADALVVGAGPAGLAAAIRLGRAGLRVTCIDPASHPRDRVGESLDFAAPSIMADLGIDSASLVARGIGTRKAGVVAHTTLGERVSLTPPRWVQHWPLSAGVETLHVDRRSFDELLYRAAERSGVRFHRSSVVDITRGEPGIQMVTAKDGAHLRARWYVDASGRSRVLGRRMGIRFDAQGPKRIAYWVQCDGASDYEGTEIWVDTRSNSLAWAWQIPIGRDRLSVGVVHGFDRFQTLRSKTPDIQAIFEAELSRLRPFGGAFRVSRGKPDVRSYQPGVMSATTGRNWLLTGEAACMADPLTSSGVTLALRHGLEAADIIIRDRTQPSMRGSLAAYHRRVEGVASTYNYAIEKLIYEPSVRQVLGSKTASTAYATVGFGVSSVYTRLKPTTQIRTRILCWLLGAFMLWTRAWTKFVDVMCRWAKRRGDAASG